MPQRAQIAAADSAPLRGVALRRKDLTSRPPRDPRSARPVPARRSRAASSRGAGNVFLTGWARVVAAQCSSGAAPPHVSRETGDRRGLWPGPPRFRMFDVKPAIGGVLARSALLPDVGRGTGAWRECPSGSPLFRMFHVKRTSRVDGGPVRSLPDVPRETHKSRGWRSGPLTSGVSRETCDSRGCWAPRFRIVRVTRAPPPPAARRAPARTAITAAHPPGGATRLVPSSHRRPHHQPRTTSLRRSRSRTPRLSRQQFRGGAGFADRMRGSEVR